MSKTIKTTTDGQTKMIIITSNEDVIRQFSLNNTTNTHVIDLDNDKQATSIAKDNNNIINMALLAELSQLNSSNDLVYKRVLNSPDHHRPKSVKISKKSTDLICTICGDRATGFNYDVLSCASCKAFFRRNAQQTLEKLKCLAGQGQCSVARGVRRKCQRCRLDRCFAMGMRKDFILSEEEKQRRKERLEENRNNSSKRSSTSEATNSSHPLSNSESISQTLDEIDRLMMDINQDDDNINLDNSTNLNEIEDISLETLSGEDWITIQNLRSSFLLMSQNNITNHSFLDILDRTSALLSWSQMLNQTVLRFISFFRQIDEFESLHVDDRFILIKYNLFSIYPISKCYNHTMVNDSSAYEWDEEARKRRRFFMLCFETNDTIRQTFLNLVISLVELTEQDPILLSLFIAVLIFSQGLSMSEDEPALNDPLAVYRAQVHYTRLLWNYMVNKQGEMKTCKMFTQLLTIIFRIQSVTKGFREFLLFQFTSSNTVDRLEPLMQTILNIS